MSARSTLFFFIISSDFNYSNFYFMANRWENNENSDFILLGSKIIADIDCSCEIKRCLLLGRKAMTNLDIILPTRICHSFSSEEASPNFMAAATMCSDLEAQENNTYHCFYFFSIY